MKTVEDPRNPSGRRHTIELVLSIAILAILSGCEGYLSVGEWIKIRQKELINFFNPKRSDLSSYSTIRRVFIAMDSKKITNNFLKWTTSLNEKIINEIEWISIDGICIKGSADKETGQ